MTEEQLAEIRKQVEKLSKGNILRDTRVLALNNKVVFEDVPKLLTEIEHLRGVISRLRCESCGDELGNTWGEINGVALCKDCSEGEL
jgi:hypothetical protein